MTDYTLLIAQIIEALQKISSAAPDLPAQDILTKLKTVDGQGSGLDADTLDGLHASAFALTSDVPDNDLKTIDGHGSGLDADTVDGFHASTFAIASDTGAFVTMFDNQNPIAQFYPYIREGAGNVFITIPKSELLIGVPANAKAVIIDVLVKSTATSGVNGIMFYKGGAVDVYYLNAISTINDQYINARGAVNIGDDGIHAFVRMDGGGRLTAYIQVVGYIG